MNPKRMPALSQKEVNAIRANKPAPVSKRPMPMLTPQQINSIKNSPRGVLPTFLQRIMKKK